MSHYSTLYTVREIPFSILSAHRERVLDASKYNIEDISKYKNDDTGVFKILNIEEISAHRNDDPPLIFKILLSANTQECYSPFWDHVEEEDEDYWEGYKNPLALCGDYDGGIKKLEQFFELLSSYVLKPPNTGQNFLGKLFFKQQRLNQEEHHAQIIEYFEQIKSNVIEFFNSTKNRQPYFLLDAMDIFVLSDEIDVKVQNNLLLERIRSIDKEIKKFLELYSASNFQEQKEMMQSLARSIGGILQDDLLE